VLDVCRTFPDHFEVRALGARSSWEEASRQAREFNCPQVVMAEAAAGEKLRSSGLGVKVSAGPEAMVDMASHPDIDHVVVASSGTGAIGAVAAALKEGKAVSLANKESIVAAGEWILPLAKGKNQLRPLDSEHNAIWQCLGGRPLSQVAKIILTASGGPFRNFSREELKKVTPAMAVSHPVWDMGAKISVDSATLMNKGIEILEAMALFSLPSDRVDAVICPDSFVHGIVEFTDGSFLMSASSPDMRLPCASALFHPGRSPFPPVPVPLLAERTIIFLKPDEERFPCLSLAKEAARRGGPFPALLIGADEAAVENFLNGFIGFTDISSVVESVMENWRGLPPKSLAEALEVFEEGKKLAEEFCRRLRNSNA
ncbi:MAG: 1-deoxy-D-xylulose-5-phosphate reductoisomerase, partial [Synergistaceae bacterium]|nr:1-deoxy-D-xylulose-5-phosphate reductoisomerase [Synergistaceae bacterium]